MLGRSFAGGRLPYGHECLLKLEKRKGWAHTSTHKSYWRGVYTFGRDRPVIARLNLRIDALSTTGPFPLHNKT